MTVHSSGEQIEAVLARLRAEEPLEQDAMRQALLRHEIGALEEARGEEKLAAREYLAAYNTEPEFREPLEALVRMFGRRREDKNLPKLLETLVDTAVTPEESARALWELAAYRQDVQEDLAGARLCLERAVDLEPASAACWLELELIAAKDGDVEARMKALEARAGLTTDPTLQGALLVELAELFAEAGELQRATELLDTVVALEGRARYRSRLALERVALQAGDTELQAHALEGQAELIAQGLEDPAVAEQVGVPSIMCTVVHVADAWLRAGELRRRSGDAWGAVAALTAASDRFSDSALVARLRIAAADAAGDAAGAVAIAREQLERGVAGAVGSSLWLRIGIAAQRSGDHAEALLALGKALSLDAGNTIASTLQVDWLASGDDAQALAQALELQAQEAPAAGRARAWITVAYVWAVRAGDLAKGKEALAQAAKLGFAAEQLAGIARCFAALRDDRAWYEEATEQLLELVSDPRQRATLCFELGRHRLLRGDGAAALEAFAQLAASSGEDDASSPSSWLGRVLGAYAVGFGAQTSGAATRDGQRLLRFAEAEQAGVLGQGLAVLSAAFACRGGKFEKALELLEVEHQRTPGDVVVAGFLADMRRVSADLAGAAQVLTDCANSNEDAPLSAALRIEAGFMLWHADKRADAVAAFELALEYAPIAARLVLCWASRGVDPDDMAARRRAAELAEESETDRAIGALDRFGLGVATRDAEVDAWAALEQLEDLELEGDLALAVVLGRLFWSNDAPDADTLGAALERIEQLGGAAGVIAAAERFRLARFVQRDAVDALEAATAWATREPELHTALEWLGAAFAADDRNAEIEARRAVAAGLQGEAAVEARSAVVLASLVGNPGTTPPFLASDSELARLTNLELAPPGGDCGRRARALRSLGDALGSEAEADAERLAAWSDLARGDNEAAQSAFKKLVGDDANDLASWEGLRDASDKLDDHVTRGVALARLGNLCKDDKRAGELWEQAGLVLLEHTDAHEDAEIAFERALERDTHRSVAFDKLFRRVRARNEDDRLLKLIASRLEVADDDAEVTKMYWEQARVLRHKDDQEGALESLKNVTLLEPDHVGALALHGEISITRGDFAEAAPLLARLAQLPEAPKQQRLMSGVAAVDLYEKKLKQPELALKVLSKLYADGLSTIKVRERLASTAAQVGNWEVAVKILERLMTEREHSKGRVEAARLALRIHRDKLEQPANAEKAVTQLLKEIPDDSEAIETLLRLDVSEKLKGRAVPSAMKLVAKRLAEDPIDLRRLRLLVEIAAADSQLDLQHAGLGVIVALGEADAQVQTAIAKIDARMAQLPQIVLGTSAILEIADPHDEGPLAELFAALAQTVSAALGPSLKSVGVGRKQRVDAGDPLRVEVSRWMGALGLGEFEMYVGGRDERGVTGVAADMPAIIVGEALRPPLDAAGRAAVAREVFALRRGTTAVLRCDDHTLASIATAVSNRAGVPVPEPRYAVYKEVERVINKSLSRKLRKSIASTCQRVIDAGGDVHVWAAAARRSIDRMTLIAAGNPSIVIDQVVGLAGTPARSALDSNVRAKRLLSFALSNEYLALRHKLGMGVQ